MNQLRRPVGDPVRLAISKIRRDGGTQMRDATPREVMAQYEEDLKAGDKFPPVWVFFDGTSYWCVDGHIRITTAASLGHAEVDAIVEMGTQRDAILAACGVNREHGAHRTRDDARRAVTRLLSDPEWRKWSDREIASRCGVTHPTVATIRKSIWKDLPDTKGRTVERKGKSYIQNTSAIGKGSKLESIRPSNHQVASVVVDDEQEESEGNPRSDSDRFYEDWIEVREVYLAKCPAYRKLAGYSKSAFEDEAVGYHYAIEISRPLVENDPDGMVGRFSSPDVEWAMSNGGPTTWVDCPDCKDSRGLSTGWHGDYNRHYYGFCDKCNRKGFITGRKA